MYPYIVEKYPSYITEIVHPSKELQFIVVKQDPMNLEYIVLPDEEVADYAVSENSDASIYRFESPNFFTRMIQSIMAFFSSLFI